VCVEGEGLIGFAGRELRSGYPTYTTKGFVEQGHRRRGVVRLLEVTLVDSLRERGVRQIELLADTANPVGAASRQALG